VDIHEVDVGEGALGALGLQPPLEIPDDEGAVVGESPQVVGEAPGDAEQRLQVGVAAQKGCGVPGGGQDFG
jgi:hypothetical protein